MAAADYYSQVQQAYIAYYGRPADPAGLIYWANQLNQAGGDLNQIINAFGNSAESTALYSSGNLYTELNQIYQTLFGRDADSAGANYYVEQIQTGKMTLASIALNVYNGAQGSDADALAAKLQFATAFTNDLLQNATAAAAYGGDAAAGNARTALQGVTDSASAQTAINNLPTTIANIGAGAVTYLTTGADVVTGSNIVGSLTQYQTDGKGPTLNYNDVITGSTGGTNNTLTLNDDYAGANDVIPLGASISNIQNVVLQTAGNAGGTAAFDTSNISGVTNLTVKSAGTSTDNVKAAATTDINVSHLATSGSVLTAGGNNVTVNTAAGNVTVGSTTTANVNPVGAVNVTAANSGTVNVYGGTTVTVNDAGQNSTVNVGVAGTAASSSEPSGAVTVNATGAGTNVNVYGGTDVTVNTVGADQITTFSSDAPPTTVTVGDVTIGAISGNKVYAPTGNVTVNVNAATAYAENYATGELSGYESDVTVFGGANVSVTTNAGNVTIGGTTTDAAGNLLAGENATGTVNVTETSNISDVTVYGGTDVSVNAVGGHVNIGSVVSSTAAATPSGTVIVNNTASVAYDGILNTNNGFVAVEGGTDVNVTTNAGGVRVGSSSGTAGTEPTGNVTVTDTTAGFVGVYGGADVTVSSAGGFVRVGSDNAGASATGDVSVTQSAVETGGQFSGRSGVHVVGGDNVTVNTTGGNVSVGSAATPTTGAVVINDSFGGYNVDDFTVVGGTTVAINTTATSGDINVGQVSANIDSVTGQLLNASDYASGNVTIVNETKVGSSTTYGTSDVAVTTNGATSVSITGASTATITDVQTTEGLTNGVSTLSSVTLNHVEATFLDPVVITSDALTSLTVLNGTIGANYEVVNTTKGHDLALTIGGDATAGSVATDVIKDATAGAVTVADNGVASGNVDLQLATATGVTVNTTAAVNLGVEAGASLTNITLNNTAALTLSVDGATNLASIDASSATGGVTVEVAPTLTSFKGGAGNDVVTIDSNSLLHADETTYSTISGGAGNNTLVANYVAQTTDTALGSNAHITGFSTLALGESAKSDTHTGSVYVAGVPAVTAVAQVSNLTFSQGHDYNRDTIVGESISVTITVGATPHVISYPITADTTVQNVAAGLAGAILAAGLTGFSVALQTGAIVITGPSDGTAFTISDATLTNPDLGDIGATATPSTPAVLGSAGTPADASYDASGFTALQVGQTAGDVAFTKVAAGTTLDVTASQGGASIVNYLLANSTGSKDALSLTVGVDGAAGSNGVTTTVATTGIETLNITSEGAAKSLNTVTIGDTGATSIVLNGDANIALTLKTDNLGAFATGVTKVDASAATGAVNLSGVELSSTGATVKGGAGLLTVAGGADAAHSDVITTGTGGGVITIGAGGSWVPGTPNGAYGAGSETVDLSASASAVDTLVVGENTVATFNGSTGGVKGFEITSSAKTTDRLTVVSSSTTVNVVANAALQNASIAGLAYTISNGIVTFSGAGTHNISEFSATDLIAAAQAIASIAYSGTDTVLAFVAGGNTYVVSAEGNTLHDTSVTELVGVTGVAGFGTTAAGNTIVLANTVTSETNVLDVATVGAKTLSYDETGYARAVLNTTSVDVAAATSVSLSNLAASAVLEVNADLSNVAVSTTQLGTSGSDSLSLVFDATNTIGSLTVSGDNALAIQTSAATTTDTITSFVDATNTVASITAAGAGNLVIGSLADTALKSFDASHVSGALTLTASQDGLTILGATGGDTIKANGAADTITVGSSTAAATGAVSITANGAADTISITTQSAGSTNHVVQAIGAGDTITINGGSHDHVIVGGTVNNSNVATTALGQGDTVNLFGSGSDSVWLGNGSTLNLGSATHVFSGTANIAVTGDVTGATSSGNFAQTLININSADASVNLTFDNAVANGVHGTEALAGGSAYYSQVNVASASSLSQALDLAVKQALVLDYQHGQSNTQVVNGVLELNANTGLISTFQYAGNTYVVEAVNNTNAAAAHTALGAHDVVVELTGTSTVSGVGFTGHTLSAQVSNGVAA